MAETLASPTIADLCQEYDWLLEGTPSQLASAEMAVLYCPVTRQEGVHAINLPHAFGGIVAARAGTRVEYAMESPVVEEGWQKPMQRWFELADVPTASLPAFTALGAPTTAQTSVSTLKDEAYSTNPWRVVQRFSDVLQNATDVSYFAAALKIAPPSEVAPDDVAAFASRFKESSGRLDTAFLVTRGLHRVLQMTDPSTVVTLSGLDERPFWRLWDHMFAPDGDGPAHLYFPTVITIPPDQPLSWHCAEDLIRAFEISAPATDLNDPNAYIPWLARQIYMLGKTIFHDWNETDTVRDWHELAGAITVPEVRRSVAVTISRFLLQLPAVPAGLQAPRQA